MASWGATARVDAPVARPRPRVKPKAKARAATRPVDPVRSGVMWIVIVGALLAGLVALNVAVLQLNVRLDKLSEQRATLRDKNAALASQFSSAKAAPRIQALARKRLGLQPADPSLMTYVELGRK